MSDQEKLIECYEREKFWQEKLIECYEQIGDLRQTLREIAIIAGDLSHQGGPYGKFAAERISERALSACDRTKPNMESEYAKTAD